MPCGCKRGCCCAAFCALRSPAPQLGREGLFGQQMNFMDLWQRCMDVALLAAAPAAATAAAQAASWLLYQNFLPILIQSLWSRYRSLR